MLSIIFLGSDDDWLSFQTGTQGNSYQVTHLSRSEELSNDQIRNSDLILLPYRLQSQNSLPLCHQLRQLNPHLLCILLVDADQAHHAIESFRSGAFDVLSVPYEPQELLSSLRKSENFIAHRAYIYSQQQPPGELDSDIVPVAVSAKYASHAFLTASDFRQRKFLSS
ncbi:hypothetical protein [Thiomicrorhabdus sp.]|uniref:hypothetical protein n=1 Tax=Thiomicrorhabdus sp. TaxID=2039724 RepID=UPI0029C617ED|nr:hypothetical protein [Thiomicrorhabdus sp.]